MFLIIDALGSSQLEGPEMQLWVMWSKGDVLNLQNTGNKMCINWSNVKKQFRLK